MNTGSRCANRPDCSVLVVDAMTMLLLCAHAPRDGVKLAAARTSKSAKMRRWCTPPSVCAPPQATRSSSGPGKIALLEAIRDTRSITAAAKAIGMSYRRAWILVDEMNRALASAAVESATGGERGGGSTLTALGHELVDVYRRIERTAARAGAQDIEHLLEIATPPRAGHAAPRRRPRSPD